MEIAIFTLLIVSFASASIGIFEDIWWLFLVSLSVFVLTTLAGLFLVLSTVIVDKGECVEYQYIQNGVIYMAICDKYSND